MGSKAKAPKAPDYTALAKEQAKAQTEMTAKQTIANRPDQVNSMGSLKWSQDPTTGQWTQTETLNPEIQAARDAALGLQNKQIQQVSSLMDQGPWQGGPEMPTYSPTGVRAGAMPTYQNTAGEIGDYQNTAGDVADFTGGQINRQDMPQYDQASGETYAQRFTENLLGRVRPQQAIDQEKMAGKLRLQGLQPGTAAYDRAYQNLITSQGDVNAQAQLQGLLAGTQEARNVYNTQLGGQQQDFSQQQGMAENDRSNYATGLAGQQQRYGQGAQDYQLGLQGQQQRYGQGAQDYQLGLAGQNQDFQQQLGTADNARSDYGALLAGQQQGAAQSLQKYLTPFQTAQMSQGLASGIQSPSFQAFMGAVFGTAADTAGAAQQQYAQAMQAYNDKQQAKSGKMGSLGSLAGAGIGAAFGGPIGMQAGAGIGGSVGGMFSDIALKEDITPISDEEAYNKLLTVRPYSFIWPSGKRGSGLLAQEVADVFPQLVHAREQGYLAVDYEGFTALLLGAFRHMAAKEKANG